MMTIEIKINHGQPLAAIEVARHADVTDTQHADGTITSTASYSWSLWQPRDGSYARMQFGDGIRHKVDDGAVVLAALVLEHVTRHLRPEQPGVKALRMLADLDRCEHGRHYGDECYGCKGPSIGNLRGTGTLIGHSLSGRPYLMPEPGKTGDPDAWVSGD